jgi:hypothetical protein
LPREGRQIEIAADNNICGATLSKIQIRLVTRIAANDRAGWDDLNDLAERQILGEEFVSLFRRKSKFWIGENPCNFRRRYTGYERRRFQGTPMPEQPAQPPIRETQSRNDCR